MYEANKRRKYNIRGEGYVPSPYNFLSALTIVVCAFFSFAEGICFWKNVDSYTNWL